MLLVKLLEIGGRPVTLLDGDLVRRNRCGDSTGEDARLVAAVEG